MKKNLNRNTIYTAFRSFFMENRLALAIMFLLFAARMFMIYETGIEYSLESDDLSYVKSGIVFANTGVITMHDQYPSGQIMPGMTVLIGVLSLVFGEGKLLWLVLKLLWISMGTLSAWYIYKSVSLFAPKWCGIVAMLPLFRPDYIWMDTVILTETPFLLSLVMMVYYTLKMGQAKTGYKNFVCCMLAYFFGLMLKANIAPYPAFALVYLLIVKYDWKVLFKQCVILGCAILCFVIPWSIRNYIHYQAFIPLTYGAGNPTLLGTYQGRGYPTDEQLDYETNVDAVVREECAKYYNADGTVKPEYLRYVSLQRDGIKASYRQRVWLEKDPVGFVYSYLVSKPLSMIDSIFYWRTSFGVPAEELRDFPLLEMALCLLTAFAAVVLKKYRVQIFYILALYFGNIYIYAMTFSFSRYNASIVYLRYIVIGIGISLIFQLIAKGYRAVLAHEKIQADTDERDNLNS